MDIFICKTDSLCCTPEANTTLSQLYSNNIKKKRKCKEYYDVLFLLFKLPSWYMEFLGQGLNLSLSFNLHYSCSNAGSLTTVPKWELPEH